MKKMFNVVLLFNLSIMFLAQVINYSGALPVIVFLLCTFIMIVFFKSTYAVICWLMALMINFALIEANILDVISVRKIIFALLVIICGYEVCKKGIHLKKNNLFLLTWYGYIILNQIFINKNSNYFFLFSLTSLFICSYMLKDRLEDDVRNQYYLFDSVFVGLLFVMLIGILEHFVGSTFFMIKWTITNRYNFHNILAVGSTVSDTNNYAMMMLALVFFSQLNIIKKRFGNRLCKIVTLAAVILSVLADSRSAYVAFSIALIIRFLLGRRKEKFVVLLPIILVAAYPAFNAFLNYMNLEEFSASNDFRAKVLIVALEGWMKRPIFGYGSLEYLDVLGKYAHNTMNTYVYMLHVYGIIGLLFYCIYWMKLFMQYIKRYLTMVKIEDDQLNLICVVCCMMIMAFSLDTFTFAFLWVLPAIFDVCYKKVR